MSPVGFEYETVAIGSRDQNAAQQCISFTVILSDIGMPDEDGFAFMRKIRERERRDGARTPAAAFTAFARTDDRNRVLRAGYQMHLAKPVEPVELATAVASLAESRSK